MKIIAFDIEKGDIIKVRDFRGYKYVKIIDSHSANSVYADFNFEGVGLYGVLVDPKTLKSTKEIYRQILDILDEVELIKREKRRKK